MSNLPYMQFYPADWLADTRMMTASAKGVWIDTLAVLWSAAERGLRVASEREWARLWGVESERVPALLEELGNVAGIRREMCGRESRVMIYSRRMIREELERERTRNSKRQEEKREWAYRETILGKVPEIFPDDSRNIPGELPEDSRQIPGDIPDTRGQSSKRERENAGASVRRPTLDEAMAAAANIGVSPDKASEWWHCREASEWLKGMAGGGTSPVGSNWQADLKTYASRGNLNPPRSSAATTEHRAAKAAREYTEPPKPPLPRL